MESQDRKYEEAKERREIEFENARANVDREAQEGPELPVEKESTKVSIEMTIYNRLKVSTCFNPCSSTRSSYIQTGP